MKIIGLLNKKKFQLPNGVKLIELPHKIRFQGTADQLKELSEEIRKISILKENQKYEFGKYIFKVSEFSSEHKNTIQLPSDAWNVMASKFREVANNWEESPFDFNDCGYLNPRLEFDIGVELIGESNPR